MKKILSLDIGGTNTRAALIDENYKIEEISVLPTVTGDVSSFFNNIQATVEGLSSLKDVVAIAGGLPGVVSRDGFIHALPNVGIYNIPLREMFEKAYGLPCFLLNDAEVAALAEANLGIYKDEPSLYFMTISTGVGGAMTVGGKLHETSYEVGHTVVRHAGRYHEFERICSGNGIVNLARMRGIDVALARFLFEMVRGGNPLAIKITEEWTDLLAEFFMMLQRDFDPAVFTITGGVTKSADCFLDSLKRKAKGCRIELCSFKEEAGLAGAAVLGFQQIAK